MKTNSEKVLFLHGAWHGAWCWEAKFVPYFQSKGFECYTFNLRGHDKAGKIKGINKHRIKHYVADLRAKVEQTGEDVTIVGHSMGGLVLQKYLEKYTCKRAILLAPVPTSGVLRITGKLLFTRSYALGSLLSLNLYKLVNTPNKAAWSFFSDNLPKEELDKYANQLCSESFTAFLGMIAPWVKVNYHTKIPMLVIGAEQDNIFTVKEVKRTARKYGTEVQILSDIAHDIMLEPNWQVAADNIVTWLESND